MEVTSGAVTPIGSHGPQSPRGAAGGRAGGGIRQTGTAGSSRVDPVLLRTILVGKVGAGAIHWGVGSVSGGNNTGGTVTTKRMDTATNST